MRPRASVPRHATAAIALLFVATAFAPHAPADARLAKDGPDESAPMTTMARDERAERAASVLADIVDQSTPHVVTSADRFVWDPYADWLTAPDQANPTPDRYGNPGVWSYLAGPSLDHDPATYLPMPTYHVDSPTYEKWTYPHDVYLLVAHVSNPSGLQMHTGAGWLTVLAWRSPIDGSVQVTGSINLLGSGCANLATGVIFSIDRGSHILSRVVLNEPGQEAIGTIADVTAGESLYFVLDPGRETNCDTSVVTISIVGQGSIPDTAMPAP